MHAAFHFSLHTWLAYEKRQITKKCTFWLIAYESPNVLFSSVSAYLKQTVSCHSETGFQCPEQKSLSFLQCLFTFPWPDVLPFPLGGTRTPSTQRRTTNTRTVVPSPPTWAPSWNVTPPGPLRAHWQLSLSAVTLLKSSLWTALREKYPRAPPLPEPANRAKERGQLSWKDSSNHGTELLILSPANTALMPPLHLPALGRRSHCRTAAAPQGALLPHTPHRTGRKQP